MPTRRAFALLAAMAVLGLPAPAARAADTLTVFAAASLKTALDEANAAWRADGGNEAKISYAASSALAKQIEQGAPADVFFSADVDWMDYLAKKDLIDTASETKLLGNELVLIAPKDSSVTAKLEPGVDLAQLLGSGLMAMADVKAVPAGKYGKAALESLGAWSAIQGKLAQAENVRAALKLVATGNAPLGIVYRTDAQAEPTVKIIATFPENSHPPIIYPVARTKSGKPEAAAFIAFLKSPRAQEIFRKQGFTILDQK